MSLLASLQDWDAVYFFNYEDKSDQWDADRLSGFFQINSQPSKLALLGACGKMFREADLPALTKRHTSAEGAHLADGALAFEQLVGLDPKLERVVGTSPPEESELAQTVPPRLSSPDGTAIWDATDPQRASILVNTPKTKAAWGLIGNQQFTLGDWEVAFGDLPQDYGVFIATSRDHRPLNESTSVLICAVNHAENASMGWNESHTSVGTDWGNGPTVAWGVPVTLRIPAAPDDTLKLWALDGDGQRTVEVTTKNVVDGRLEFQCGPQHKTLVYELVRQVE